jgi:hypothetical protein
MYIPPCMPTMSLGEVVGYIRRRYKLPRSAKPTFVEVMDYLLVLVFSDGSIALVAFDDYIERGKKRLFVFNEEPVVAVAKARPPRGT